MNWSLCLRADSAPGGKYLTCAIADVPRAMKTVAVARKRKTIEHRRRQVYAKEKGFFSTALEAWAAVRGGARFRRGRRGSERRFWRRSGRRRSDCRWKRLSTPFRQAIPRNRRPASAARLFHATEPQILRARD